MHSRVCSITMLNRRQDQLRRVSSNKSYVLNIFIGSEQKEMVNVEVQHMVQQSVCKWRHAVE